MIRPTSSRSWAVVPGRGSAVWRTCQRRSKRGSSAHTGLASPSGVRLTRWRKRGTRLSRVSTCASSSSKPGRRHLPARSCRRRGRGSAPARRAARTCRRRRGARSTVLPTPHPSRKLAEDRPIGPVGVARLLGAERSAPGLPAPLTIVGLGRVHPAPVAQLDRASVYETEGHRFESCRARSRDPSQMRADQADRRRSLDERRRGLKSPRRYQRVLRSRFA